MDAIRGAPSHTITLAQLTTLSLLASACRRGSSSSMEISFQIRVQTQSLLETQTSAPASDPYVAGGEPPLHSSLAGQAHPRAGHESVYTPR